MTHRRYEKIFELWFQRRLFILRQVFDVEPVEGKQENDEEQENSY